MSVADGASDAALETADLDTSQPLSTPDEIFGDRIVGWLDADDPSFLALGDGGAVLSWYDRVYGFKPSRFYLPYLPNADAAVTWHAQAARGRGACDVGEGKGMFVDERAGIANSAGLVMAVIAFTNPPGATGVISRGTNGAELLVNIDGGTHAGGGAVRGFDRFPTVQGSLNDGEWHVISMRFAYVGPNRPQTDAVWLRVDGVEQVYTGSTSLYGLTAMRVAGDFEPENIDDAGNVRPAKLIEPLNGSIAELLVVQGKFPEGVAATPDELAALGRYIKFKYNLVF